MDAQQAGPGRRRQRALGGVTVMAALTVGTLLLTACGANSVSTASTGMVEPAHAPVAGDAAAGAAGAGTSSKELAADPNFAAGAPTPGAVSNVNVAIVPRQIVRTAAVTMDVKDLAGAIRSVHTIAIGLGGYVSSEKTGLGNGGYKPSPEPTPMDGGTSTSSSAPVDTTDRESVIELRIPVQRLDEAIAAVEKVGSVSVRTSSAQDVTGDVADLSSRMANQKASVERIRSLMQAATSIKDIVLLESELSQREGELKALQARLATLKDQAELATYTVDLVIPTSFVAAEPSSGFMAGLQGGWKALSVSTVVVVTAIGALLPPAVVLALIGLPIWWLLRRRRRPATGNAVGASAPTV